MKKLNKKGQIMSTFSSLGIGIASLAILLVISLLIISEGQDQVVNSLNITNTTNTSHLTHAYAYNATQTMQDAVADVPSWAPLIIIAVIGGALIGIVTLFRRR